MPVSPTNTSKNLWDWKYAGKPQINSNIIDPALYRTPEGTWKMWYKDQNRGSVTMMAESKNLKKWITHDQPAIGGNAHEGPKVFRFGNYYWMITHPGRKSPNETRNDESGNLSYQYRRSCIQVAPLTIQDGLLICAIYLTKKTDEKLPRPRDRPSVTDYTLNLKFIISPSCTT